MNDVQLSKKQLKQLKEVKGKVSRAIGEAKKSGQPTQYSLEEVTRLSQQIKTLQEHGKITKEELDAAVAKFEADPNTEMPEDDPEAYERASEAVKEARKKVKELASAGMNRIQHITGRAPPQNNCGMCKLVIVFE